MDFEKAYNEALERAKMILCNIHEGSASVRDIETIFPELRESEDERIRKEDEKIRKELVAFFAEDVRGYYWHDLDVADILAWLEKQKEQKPVENPINWTELTWKDIIELEVIINKVNYEFRNGIGQEPFGKAVLERFREYKGDEYLDEIEQKPTLNWRTIEQATTKRTDEGDCVTTEKMLIKGILGNDDYHIVDKDVMVNKNLLCIPVSELNAEEQKSCDDLDSEIKRFFDECIVVHEAEIYGRKERVIEVEDYELTARHFANWQKERKPAEWSEEDEKTLASIIDYLDRSDLVNYDEFIEFEEFLKSLRPSWKPSEEQMKALQNAVALAAGNKVLAELYEQLKAL